MSESHGAERPSMQGVIPYLNVDGASEASAFYQRAFGAREAFRMAADDGKRLMHCHLEINGGSLMLSDCFPEHGFPFEPSKGVSCLLVVNEGEFWWKRAVDAGCEIQTPFQKMFWGDQYGQLIDPFQVRWAINQPAIPV